MEPVIEKQHIVATPGTCGGKPRVSGTRIRVQDIMLWTENGQSPEQIVTDFPQLTLADVHAALAYYFDHREEIEGHIKEADEIVARMMASPSLRGPQQPTGKDANGNSVSS